VVASHFSRIAGLLARSQYPEGPATGHLGRHRFFLVSLCLKANSEMVPKILSCYCMLLMSPSRLKFLRSVVHIYVHALLPLPPGDSQFEVKFMIMIIISLVTGLFFLVILLNQQ
jgi:hypothetical protein